MKALHIGCQDNILDGWINSDLEVCSWIEDKYKDKILCFNAEEHFPFDDNELDFIYSEHVIEHLSYEGFKNYISESYRCLKPGGVIRTACPYLDFNIELWQNPHKYKKFIKQHCEMFHNELFDDWGDDVPAMFILNDDLRMWGHQIMYDKSTLIKMFSKFFNNIKQCNYQESEYDMLRCLESNDKRGNEHNKLETIIFECTKP